MSEPKQVLLSEVAGEGRWSQFNLKLEWVEPFFSVSSTKNSTIPLCELDHRGEISGTHQVEAIYKPGSRNWAFEIPDASQLDYPGEQNRPILAVSQRFDSYFSFELVMPNDLAYDECREFLYKNRQTSNRELCRCVVSRNDYEEADLGLNI